MAIVSSDEQEGYQLHAEWLHGVDETPKFDVQVFTPNGEDLGHWIVSGKECNAEVAMDMAFQAMMEADNAD